MLLNDSLEVPADLQVRLQYLREKKAVLDQSIACLERYLQLEPGHDRRKGPILIETKRKRLAGAA